MTRISMIAGGVVATLTGLGLLGWLLWVASVWLWAVARGWTVAGLLAVGLIAVGASMWRRRGVMWPPARAKRRKARPTMANLEQYKNWCMQRIAGLVVEQEVHAQASVQRGPFTLVFTLRIMQDPVGGLRKLLALGPTLQMLLQTNVRVLQGSAGVLVEVELPKQAHITPNAAKLARAARWPQIPLGLDQAMKPICVNPETHGALYWVAPPRSGKTQSMRSTLYLILKSAYDVRFLICALPAKIDKDWGIFSTLAGCLGMVSDFAEMDQALAWTVLQMNTGAYPGKTIIILDDLTSLMVQAPAISSHIDNLALTGPGLGYHLLVGTHGAGSIATTGGKMAQFAMTCRVLYKAADNTTGSRSSGRKNAETGLAQLSGAPGDAILDEHGRIQRIATGWVRDADILALPAASQPPSRPWQERVTSHAPSQPLSHPGDRAVTSGRHGLSPLSHPAGATPTNGATWPTREGVRDTVTTRDNVTRDDVLAEVPAGMFPINPERAMSQSEDAWLRRLMDSGLFSESALADVVYGQRNKRRLAYVRESLARTGSQPGPGGSPATSHQPLTEGQAIRILEGDPAHPRRAEALEFFNLAKEAHFEDA